MGLNFARLDWGNGQTTTHELSGWPPPQTLDLFGDGEQVFDMVRCSQLSDEVADHPNIARGAEYVLRVPGSA